MSRWRVKETVSDLSRCLDESGTGRHRSQLMSVQGRSIVESLNRECGKRSRVHARENLTYYSQACATSYPGSRTNVPVLVDLGDRRLIDGYDKNTNPGLSYIDNVARLAARRAESYVA